MDKRNIPTCKVGIEANDAGQIAVNDQYLRSRPELQPLGGLFTQTPKKMAISIKRYGEHFLIWFELHKLKTRQVKQQNEPAGYSS